jgi:GNAT superfamily N-acetyltransferase
MARPPSADPAGDRRFWEPYHAVARQYSSEVRICQTIWRERVIFELPRAPWGMPGVPPATLWHGLKEQIVALDVGGIEKPLRLVRAMRPHVPLAICLNDLPSGVRLHQRVPELDLKISLGEQAHEVRHAVLASMLLRRWWSANLGNWQRWRDDAESTGPFLEARRIRPHETWVLRQSVLRPHQDIREMAWDGDTEADAVHVGGFADGVLRAVATLLNRPPPEPGSRPGLTRAFDGPARQLRGMATAPEARGFGLGRGLLRWCMEQAARDGARLLWCNARTSAVGFYEKHGMRVVSEVFDIPGVGPHVVMVCELGEAEAGTRNAAGQG